MCQNSLNRKGDLELLCPLTQYTFTHIWCGNILVNIHYMFILFNYICNKCSFILVSCFKYIYAIRTWFIFSLWVSLTPVLLYCALCSCYDFCSMLYGALRLHGHELSIGALRAGCIWFQTLRHTSTNRFAV